MGKKKLLDLPNVAALRRSESLEDQRVFNLLELFAFETFSHYQSNRVAYGHLSDPQVRKLRQLSIVSLSGRQKSLPFSELQEELGIFDMRELEDLLLDTIYQGLIEGKLDSRGEVLRVDFAISRDVQDKDLLEVLKVLSSWSVRSETLLSDLSNRINIARGALEQDAIDRRQFEDRVKETKEKISKVMNKSGVFSDKGGQDQQRLGPGIQKDLRFFLDKVFFFFFMGSCRWSKAKQRAWSWSCCSS